MPFVEGGIVVDAEPQQQAAPPVAQGGFVQGGIEVDPTPEDSYNKVLQFEAAQTDYTPTKQEYLDYLRVSKTKPLLGETPLQTIGTAIGQTAVDIATMPYKLGEAIGEYIEPPEGVMPMDVAAATAAEIAMQSRLKAERMARGGYDVALSNLEKLTGKLRSEDDRYQAFLATAEIKRQLARANAPEEQRVPAAQEFLQAYGIPQEAITQPGLEVGGFAADPSSIAFLGGGKAASMLLQRAAPLIPRAGAALQRGGERVMALGRAPEVGAGALTTKITGSPQMGEAVQEAIAKGTTGVALGEAAGLPITAQLNVPGLGTASQVIGGTKALGATMETLGEAGAISGGQTLTPIQRGLLGAGERIAAAEGASAAARAFGTALARSGIEAPAKTAASILIPAAGAGAAGGLLAGLTGEEGDAVAAAIGSGIAFGGIDAGFRLAKAASSDALNGNRVRRTAVDDLNTRPTEVQFTYIDPATGQEQLVTIKDSEARAQLYASLDNKQLTKALSEVAGAENGGAEVIFHKDGDAIPTSLQGIGYAGVAIGPNNIKNGKPTILVNVDRAKPETLPHEILHARITSDVVAQLGSQVIETSAQTPEFQRQFTDFANKYADKLQASGAPVVADRIRTELRDAFDPTQQRAQRIESLRRMTDEFAAYYAQEFLKGKDPKTLLPGRIPSFFELAFNNAKEAVAERFTRQALQNGFDPVARTFYDANGRRIKIPWMEDAIRNLISPKEGFEPTEQKIDTRKMTQAQQNALILARGYSDLFMTAPDGSIVRPLSKAELVAKTADIANRTMKVVESVPQADRTSISGMDAKGNPIIEGRLSIVEADALSKSGIFSPSTSRYIIDIAQAIRDGTLMDGSYWKVYGSTGKAGVFGEAQKLFLPYGISINSKGGVNVKVVDWGKVQARMYKALTKPGYKNLFRTYDQAMSTLKDVYLKNIAEQGAVPSAEALGGGLEGAKKRNFFNEVMGAVPKKGDTMINFPTAGYEASRKGGSVYQDLRIERIQNANPTGTTIPWSGDMGEQSSYRRTQLNFQPAEQVGETTVQSDMVGGYRILSKGGKFRLYGPDGSTTGIFDTEGQAKLKAEKDYATQARLQPEVRQQQYPARDEGGQTPEAGRGDRAVGRTQGQGQGGPVRQAGDVRFMPAEEPGESQALRPGQTYTPEERKAVSVAKKRSLETAKKYPEAKRLEIQTDRNGNPKFEQVLDAEGNPVLDAKGNPIMEVAFTKLPYDLLGSPKLSKNRDRAVIQTADLLEADARKAFNNPEISKGIGWYSRMREFLQQQFGASIEVFGQLLGATSARTPVDTNFKQALEALKLLSTGQYDNLLADFSQYANKVYSDAKSGELLRQWQEKNPGKKPSAFKVNDEIRKQINRFEGIPLRANGKKYNANSQKVLHVLYGVWLDQTVGPKTPNFAGNLTGRTLKATIDVWAARNLRRLLYEGAREKWRLLPEQESGVTDPDFFFAQDAYDVVAKRLGMNADDLQALMWFMEKDVWEKNGWTSTVGAEKSSFDKEAGKLALDRFQAGVTTFTDLSKFKSDIQEKERLALRKSISGLEGLVAARVNNSSGLYGGVFEPSFDIEFSVSRNPDGTTKNISNQISEIIRVASQPGRVQSDVFVSQVVPVDHPNARPIMEVGFKKGASWDDISEAVAAFQDNGIDGFTLARDDRGNVIGIRAQYIPEFSAVYDSLDHLDPQMVATKMQDWVSRANAASAVLDRIDNVSYKKNGTVSTIVYGLEEYSTARPIEPGSTSRAAELGRRRSIAEQRRQVYSGADAGQAVESGAGGLPTPAGDVQSAGVQPQAEVGAQRFMPSDADYLSAVQKGDTQAAQRMVDEAAKAAGYTVGPVYHGTPTGGFNVFDKRMRGESSGISREAFSFTTNKQAAENYSKRLGDDAVRLDAGLRIANDAMRTFEDDVAAQEYFSSKGYSSVEDGMLPEFDWGSIDDVPEFIQELRGYARDLRPINKQLSDSFFQAADEMVVTKARPEVKRVFLRIPGNAPVFQATPKTLGEVMYNFSAEREPTKSGIVELPGNERVYYVADSSQVKLADPVTKDSEGNVIPLSQRFKATSEDIRYMPQPDSSMQQADAKALQMLPKPRRSLDAAYRQGVATRSQDPQYYDVPDYVGYDMARTAAFEMGREGAEPPRWVMAERIGKLPAEGRSKNFAEDKMERGVSVLRIVGEPQADIGTYEMFNPGEKRYVAGWFVGLGSDGEPLLADAVDLGPVSKDVRMMPSPDSSMPGAYSFPGGYRAIPGRAKGSLRLYGPAGNLIGIASALEEAERIIRRKATR